MHVILAISGQGYMLMYFQGVLMGTDLIERSLPLSLSLAPIGK